MACDRYMHSFGMSEHHLVFPHMPIKFDMRGAFGRSMAAAFVDLPVTSDQDLNNAFYVAPLSGHGEAFVRTLPSTKKLYLICMQLFRAWV